MAGVLTFWPDHVRSEAQANLAFKHLTFEENNSDKFQKGTFPRNPALYRRPLHGGSRFFDKIFVHLAIQLPLIGV